MLGEPFELVFVDAVKQFSALQAVKGLVKGRVAMNSRQAMPWSAFVVACGVEPS